MQFKLAVIALVASFSGVSADVHTRLYCKDVNFYASNTATSAACAAYKLRNTGTKQWDTCTDCTVITVGTISVCESKGQHMGGDEWTYYCTKNGGGGGGEEAPGDKASG